MKGSDRGIMDSLASPLAPPAQPPFKNDSEQCISFNKSNTRASADCEYDSAEQVVNADNATTMTTASRTQDGHRIEPFELEKDELTTNDRDGIILEKQHSLETEQREASRDFWQTIAGVSGNVLEWYDFAIFGYLGDIIGKVFFPAQKGDWAMIESFAVFGGAFLMRPIGGMLMGYIGDVYGRKKALVISIFLMAFPTFFMGCLPGYDQAGIWAIVLLCIVRLLQGLSVGGQLMSSLVFTLENHDRAKWGLYGSYVLAAANFGTLLGGIGGFILRASLTEEQLIAWGWRVPFLSGIIVSFSGFYLRTHGGHEEGQPEQTVESNNEDGEGDPTVPVSTKKENPLRMAFARGNLRSLLAAVMVPLLWSAGFYLSFVWMAIFMDELVANPVPHAFAVNSLSLLVSVCIFFPFAGMLSDRYGRRFIMTLGGIGMGVLSPLVVFLISKGNATLAFFAQSSLGIALSFWGSPMCAWLVEAFNPAARLTSVAIGYNLAQAIAGGSAPSIATLMVDTLGPTSPGWYLTILAVISLSGLWIVAPRAPVVDHVPASEAKFEVVPVSETDPDNSDERYENEVI